MTITVPDLSRSGRSARAAASASPCPRCGGSGQLRTGHGAYRSCLDCGALGFITVQEAILQTTPSARASAKA